MIGILCLRQIPVAITLLDNKGIVRELISKTKSGKVTRPSGLASESIKSGEATIHMMTDP